MSSLSNDQAALAASIAERLGRFEGVTGVVLGGSHARGRARPDSDIDIGIYYHEDHRFSVDALEGLARELNDTDDPVVSGFYEWGPWVNGGAWLTIDGQRVDLLYRSVERCNEVIADARIGNYQIHYAQQPPFGFFSPVYMGELHAAAPLLDRLGEVSRLKFEVETYPEALRSSVVQHCLWSVEFGLTAFAPKFAMANDVYSVAACISRFCYHLVLALFALNRRYFVNDKTALQEVSEFDRAPAGFRERVNALLGAVGDTRSTLTNSLSDTRDLFTEVVSLAGDLYRPNRLP